jgi:signal peptidase II
MKMTIKLLLITFVLLAGCQSDLQSKRLAAESLKNKPAVPLVSGYLDLRYTENEALSFSMLQSLPETVRRPLLTGLQLLSTLAVTLLLFAARKKSFYMLLPLLLILSGAFGNAWDRLRFGYVVDFIHFHIGTIFSWPIFNIADVLIAVGIGLLILQSLLNKGDSVFAVFDKKLRTETETPGGAS